jgi:hypothetical protein
MIRLFYRYMRRAVHALSEGNKSHNVVTDASKWWFDNARNLIISAGFAYYATRTGSWLAYALTQISFTFFVLFLFHPVFRFMIRATGGPRQRRSRYATLTGIWMFLNVFGIAVVGAYSLIWAIADLHGH